MYLSSLLILAAATAALAIPKPIPDAVRAPASDLLAREADPEALRNYSPYKEKREADPIRNYSPYKREAEPIRGPSPYKREASPEALRGPSPYKREAEALRGPTPY